MPSFFDTVWEDVTRREHQLLAEAVELMQAGTAQYFPEGVRMARDLLKLFDTFLIRLERIARQRQMLLRGSLRGICPQCGSMECHGAALASEYGTETAKAMLKHLTDGLAPPHIM